MAKQDTPAGIVDNFLDSRLAKTLPGGAPCQTCNLPNRKEIDEAALHFNKKRQSKQTSVSWNAFVRHVLSQEPFNYRMKWRSLLNHLERHCDAEIF